MLVEQPRQGTLAAAEPDRAGRDKKPAPTLFAAAAAPRRPPETKPVRAGPRPWIATAA